MKLSPLHKETLGHQVAEQLRNAIRDGSLTPGTRLVERDVADRLGVSRIPVREGIQQLADEGLVSKIPHRGTFVCAPTPSEIEEIATLRVVLECFAMELVTANWNSEHRVRLIHIIQTMRDSAAHQDYHRLFEQDTQFHRALWEIANHDLLLEVVSGLWARLSRFLYEAVMAQPSADLDLVVDGHLAFIDVFDRGDVAAAKELITEHIISAKQRLLPVQNKAGADSSQP